MPDDDVTLRNARREAWILIGTWAAATAYCCIASFVMGYSSPGHPLGADDVQATLGIPRWFLVSVLAPWGVCGLFTLIFAGFFMKDDDLGRDHASELDADISEGVG